jgi:hypothetical protein
VSRKTWRKLWHSYISKLFLTKMQVKFSIFFHLSILQKTINKTSKSPHAFAMCSIRTDLLKQENENIDSLFYCSNIAKSDNAMLWRMLLRLETCIVYCCIWSVTLAKSIVPRKTWRKLWPLTFLSCSCTYLAKRLRELSSTKTGSYPQEFLCRTNCSACADYQPWESSHEKQNENCDNLTFLSCSWQRCKLNFQYFFIMGV